MWREFSTLRDGLDPLAKTTEAPSREVEQLRCEVRSLCEQSASAERILGGLREEVRRCTTEAAASASSAKLAAQASARSQELAKEAGASAARDETVASLDQRLRTLEEVQMAFGGAGAAATAADDCAAEVRAQVAALERQVGHLRDLSAEAGRTAEQDQAALRAFLRASRLLAERIGVGPVIPGHETSASLLGCEASGGLLAEAEALAAGVSAAWRRQKASGAIPAGAANILEALRLQRVELSSPQRLSIDDALLQKPLAGQRHCLSTHSLLESRSDGMWQAPAIDRHWHTESCEEREIHH